MVSTGSGSAHIRTMIIAFERQGHLCRGASKLNSILHIETEPQKLRADYIELYGKEVWDQAATLASRHRARASTKYGLAKHFTAQEWLDLCALTKFCCPSCGANAPLQPHHRTALCTLGSNTIDNIAPLCSACHYQVPVPTGIKDVSAIWLAQEKDIYLKRPPVNTLIRYVENEHAPNIGRLGVVVKTEAPVLEAGPLWGRGHQLQDWGLTHARVEPMPERWLKNEGIYPPVQPLHIPSLAWVRRAGDEETMCVELRHLSAVNIEATKKEALSWLQAQEELMAPWAIGNYVCSIRRKEQGIVEQIIPYKALALTGFIGENDAPALPAQWLPSLPAMAKVRWICPDGTTKVTRVDCQNLRRTNACT